MVGHLPLRCLWGWLVEVLVHVKFPEETPRASYRQFVIYDRMSSQVLLNFGASWAHKYCKTARKGW
jgi:hypothetical protein